ncbi:hypothetical protein SDC9_177463 [bioreactor metagenome]|uniref:Uncharacterized protein n=1 Tax=bioreactor metagenome TaxID=1076179 RepID=A0A645GUS7_9ZZZZ
MDTMLHRPEYLHVILNHLPVVGLGVSSIALLIAVLAKSRGATIGCLLLVAIMAASVWPVTETGESAYNRIRAVADPVGATLLKKHMATADKWAWLFYVTALAAAAGLFVAWKRPRFTNIAAALILALSIASLTAGIAMAQIGGEVRHPEFRPGTNIIPEGVSPQHEHENGDEH